MTLPQSINPSHPNKVLKLLKSLYGLKQFSRKWFANLYDVILSHYFKQYSRDHCLFIFHNVTSSTTLVIYVDDFIIVYNNMDTIQIIKKTMHHHFNIKDLGTLKYFLGLKVVQSSKGIHNCQRKYVLYIISNTWLLGFKPLIMTRDTGLLQTEGSPSSKLAPYQRIIGQLIYLLNIRSNIVYVIQRLNQHMTNLTHVHYYATIQVLHYFK